MTVRAFLTATFLVALSVSYLAVCVVVPGVAKDIVWLYVVLGITVAAVAKILEHETRHRDARKHHKKHIRTH